MRDDLWVHSLPENNLEIASAVVVDRLRLGQGNKELTAGLKVSLVALEDRLGIDPGQDHDDVRPFGAELA